MQLYRISGRFFRRKIFPALIPALRPLKPTAEELKATLQELKTNGRKIGAKLKLKTLLDAFEEWEQSPEAVLATS